MTERSFLFGSDNRLCGIMTLPAGSTAASTACILLNAGVIHRIGPHRVNVKIARALARNGTTSFRMDLSGLGDSGAARSGANLGEQAVSDLRAGMDLVEKETGIDRFVIIGICSAAVHAYFLSLADRRIAGLLMFDGFTFPTARTGLTRRWKRFQRMSWGGAVRHAWEALTGTPSRPATVVAKPSPSTSSSSSNPSRKEFQSAMEALLQRGAAVYVMYSGSLIEAHNYEKQFRDAFRGASFLKRVRYDFCPAIDHTVTPLAAQSDFVERILHWVADVSKTSVSSAA
jgi:hypothetical protein